MSSATPESIPVARPSRLSVQDAIGRRPSWVKRAISAAEAKAIAAEIVASKASSGWEVGVASGWSSAILYAALSQARGNPVLHALDWAEDCYYDKAHKTGDAFYELHGTDRAYFLTTKTHSGMVQKSPLVDFLFIDANHQNPWPSLDLLSMGRFLRPGAIVALHDVEMIYHEWGRHASGARDLYRCWLGDKWRREGSSNVGFLRFDAKVMLESLPAALMTDWDTKVRDVHLEKFRALIVDYWQQLDPVTSGRLQMALLSRTSSANHMKLLPSKQAAVRVQQETLAAPCEGPCG